jgi:carboxymethylenebutenolidase
VSVPDPYRLNIFEPFAITYNSDGNTLRGYLLLPEGQGPFPAVIFQHGSAGFMPSNRPGIEALQRMGYAVFIALRRGHNGNSGPNWLSLVASPWGSPAMGEELVQALQAETNDVLASLAWLRAQPRIDQARIAIVGSSFGGVVAVLAAGRTTQFHAGISFAGPSQTWSYAPALQEAMLTAIRSSVIPFFLIQAQNDHSLLPTYTIAMELARLDKAHETRVYPPLGTTPGEGHGIFGGGVAWWYTDVERFLGHWLLS